MSSASSFEASRALADIRFHRSIAQAHDSYADAIAGLSGQADEVQAPELRGPLQRRVVALPELASSLGMTSKEVAAMTTGDEPNCHATLKGLVEKGVLEFVEGASPQRFRLSIKHRRDRILGLSRLIDRGEWTTYKDFSIAVYDNWRMALTVARVAARHPAFANAHRVLQTGGTVSADWRDEERKLGPDECKRRLAEEGVWDTVDDCAKPESFVPWGVLQDRLIHVELGDDPDVENWRPGREHPDGLRNS
jgi:hypothetical protein